MRTTSKTTGVAIFLLGVMVSSLAVAGPNDKFLARSINMPVEFSLCEHLDDAILYENNVPTSAMPAERTFQFTYYPDLGLLLPEQVRVEVAGKYKEDDKPFVARLAVTIDDAAGTPSKRRKAKSSTSAWSRRQSSSRATDTVSDSCPRRILPPSHKKKNNAKSQRREDAK